MRAPGGVYLLLPGGEDGSLSKHPRPGVKQIKFGLMKPQLSSLNAIKGYFEEGKLKAHVFHTFSFENASQAFALSATGLVVGKIAVTP